MKNLKSEVKKLFSIRYPLISASKGQGMAEYIIVLFLVALVVYGSYDLFSRALAGFYNRIYSARTGTTGMLP